MEPPPALTHTSARFEIAAHMATAVCDRAFDIGLAVRVDGAVRIEDLRDCTDLVSYNLTLSDLVNFVSLPAPPKSHV